MIRVVLASWIPDAGLMFAGAMAINAKDPAVLVGGFLMVFASVMLRQLGERIADAYETKEAPQ